MAPWLSGQTSILGVFSRGIEWSLRALASMQAAPLFLQARAVIKYVLRAASTLKNTDGEQEALRKFSRRNLDFSLLKRNVFLQCNLADTVEPIARQLTANFALLAMRSNYII